MQSAVMLASLLLGCNADDASGIEDHDHDDLAQRMDALEADLAASNERISTLETDLAANNERLSGVEQVLDELNAATAPGSTVFLGANDDSWAFAIGSTVNYSDVEVDDSAQDSGSVLVGEGTILATTFSSTLPAGLWEASLTANWGIGIQEEAITQDVSVTCEGASTLFTRPARLVAGDADSQGINVAHEFTARVYVQTTAAETLVSCTLGTRVLQVARSGDGVLYNDVNGPSLARFNKLAD